MTDFMIVIFYGVVGVTTIVALGGLFLHGMDVLERSAVQGSLSVWQWISMTFTILCMVWVTLAGALGLAWFVGVLLMTLMGVTP